MFKGHGSKGAGGWKGNKHSGAKAPWKKSVSNDDFSRSEMHAATCNECGNACQVPFKPNGRKPVLCSNCYIRADKSESRFEGPSPSRSFNNFHEKRPAFQPRERDTRESEIVKQLKEISAKLDVLIATRRS